MIKQKNGTTRFKGTLGEVLDDYRLVTKNLIRLIEVEENVTREEAIEKVKEVQTHGLMTDEELTKFMDEKIAEFASKLLSKILGEEREEEINE